ncbi:MAG: DUF4230 domain-containing protein [Rubrobacteraceae bacterium]
MEKGKKGNSGLLTTLLIAVSIVVISVVVGVGLARYGANLPVVGWFFGEGQPQTTTSPVVVEDIRKLDQLDTVRMTQSVVVTKETGGTELRRFLTGEEVILVAVGDVEAGVNLSDLTEEDVQVEEDIVTLQMPEPEVSSVALDEEQTRLYDRDQGILRLRPDETLVEEARQDARDELLAAARQNDIISTAERNAEDTVSAFLTTLGYEEVRFK